MAPEIPDWIKTLEHRSYKNVFSYNLGNKNLWGTETLLGDWNGHYLLIAKDYYPSSSIECADKTVDPMPYHHSDVSPTNTKLLNVLSHFGRLKQPHNAETCDFLYISACFLLRADGQVSGALPDRDGVMKVSGPVVKFTMDNMPNLRTIVLMGDDAEIGFRISGNWNIAKERGLVIHHVSHPASRGLTSAKRFEEWKSVFSLN